MIGDECVGTIICKIDNDRKKRRRGYIAMLAVSKEHRRKKLGSKLVTAVIKRMQADNADDIVLETEVTNKAAIDLYTNLGFIKTKLLKKYYMNGGDAYRLKLSLKAPHVPDDPYVQQDYSEYTGSYSDSE
jgi:peptide alpha-N-acetyltransferase